MESLAYSGHQKGHLIARVAGPYLIQIIPPQQLLDFEMAEKIAQTFLQFAAAEML